jgi:hypothetical protein
MVHPLFWPSGLPEKARSKVVEAPPPGKPFVGCAGRLEIHIVNAGRRQSVAELLGSLPFDGPDSEEHDLDLVVEGRRIGERTATGRLRIERTAPRPPQLPLNLPR